MSAVKIVTAIALGIGGVTCTWLTLRWLRKSLNRPSKTWHYVGKLQEITLYPIKSTAGITLAACECDVTGISWESISDRQFALMGENGEFYFAGSYPQMLGIKADILGKQCLRFTASGMQPLVVDIERDFLALLGTERTIRELPKQGFTRRLIEGNAAQHEWFSMALKSKPSGVRLFLNLKPLLHDKWWQLGISEYFPVMLLSRQSIDDLNQRLPAADAVDAAQFRGNLLVDVSAANVPAYAEDNWKWLKIGDSATCVILQYNSHCYRCILPNINVHTLERNKNFEPLRTLQRYRLLDNPKEPVMGVYYNVYKPGMLHKDDPVYVQC